MYKDNNEYMFYNKYIYECGTNKRKRKELYRAKTGCMKENAYVYAYY